MFYIQCFTKNLRKTQWNPNVIMVLTFSSVAAWTVVMMAIFITSTLKHRCCHQWLSFWQHFCHRLYLKLSKWQLSVQSVMKMLSKGHFPCSVEIRKKASEWLWGFTAYFLSFDVIKSKPISFKVSPQAQGQSYDCHSARNWQMLIQAKQTNLPT